MTPKYNPLSPLHNDIKHRIERGTGCHTITTEPNVKTAFQDVGFELVRAQDIGLVTEVDSVPWWKPIAGDTGPFYTWKDIVKVFCMKGWVFWCAYWIFWVGSLLGLARRERIIAMEEMGMGVFGMRDGGKLGIFSPDFFFVGRKPETKE